MLIGGIAIFLFVLLIVLLVDWRGVIRRLFPGRTPTATIPTRFSFDETEPAVEAEEFTRLESALPEPELPEYQPNDEVAELLEQADVHFRKAEMKEAEDLYVQVASKDPRCSKAYARLGIIYLEHGDNWDDAEEAFRQALKYDPQNGFVLNNLGLVLYHQDKFADAIRQFEQAVRLDEQNAARHANLGMAYMAIRQYAKAESAFKKALKLAPNEMEYKDLLNESIEKKRAHRTMVRH